MSYPPRLSRLLESFRRLPGVGPKSAQRIAFHLLDRDRAAAAQLAAALSAALEGIGHCSRCRMYCEDDRCPYCSDARRAQGSLCVVETPADLIAVEQGAGFRGRYFVLMGRLSPLDGIGPQELGLDLLQQQLLAGDCSELIIATGSTVEGEATAYYLGEMARAAGVTVTRIAHGVPLGGELEYVDGGTLARAFDGRRPLT